MSEKKYSKVLILSQSFNEMTGAGVTMTNLFRGWNKDKIAIASNNIDIAFCNKTIPCIRYYEFGRTKNVIKEYSKLHKIFHFFYHKTGIAELRKDNRLTKEFNQFIDEYEPEVIYSALGSLKEMNFILEILKDRQIPLVIHVWDDWLDSIYRNRFFSKIWEKKYDKVFRRILNKSTVRLSICSYMSEIYKKRYNYDFIPFHNPVDLKIWDSVSSSTVGDIVKILYIGKVNKDTISSLIEMSKAVESISKEFKIQFDIITPNHLLANNKFLKYKNTKILRSNFSISEIPKIYKSYDILFLTLNFEKKSVRYSKLSMLTKLSEYLASKVPILLYCSKDSATYKYYEEKKWAYYSERGVNNLINSIISLHKDDNLKKRIITNAYNSAKDNHKFETVNDNFRISINSAVSNNNI